MKNNSDKLFEAIDSLKGAKDHCSALNAKNERLRIAYAKDIRHLCGLPHPPREKIKRLLIQRKMIDRTLQVTNRHIISIFKHQLTLEQAVLHIEIGGGLSLVHEALKDTNDGTNHIVTMQTALEDMADSVCEVSDALTLYGQVDISDSECELESELALLLASPTERIAVAIESSIPIAPSESISDRAIGDDGSDGYNLRMKS